MWLVAALAALVPLTGCGEQDDQALDVEGDAQYGRDEQAQTADATQGISGTVGQIGAGFFKQIINPVVSFGVQPLPNDGFRYHALISNIGSPGVEVCGRLTCVSTGGRTIFTTRFGRFMPISGPNATRSFAIDLTSCVGADSLQYNVRANNTDHAATNCPP